MKKSVCFLPLLCSIFLLFFCSLLKSSASSEDRKPLILPLPAEIKVNPGSFSIDKSTNIIIPLKPGSYDLYFDVPDEYIDVNHPEIIHAGHDEWRMEKDLCELCRGKDYGELYAADINNWQSRGNTKGLLGGAPSSWAATTEVNFGKDQLTDFPGASNLIWSRSYLSPEKLAFVVEALAGDVNYRFRGKKLPSETGAPITTMEFSSPAINVQINSDPNSIVFLHAYENEGSNRKAYSIIHNFNETAELPGWYEIVYEDGFVETVPLRYGLNLLDLGWRQRIERKTLPIAKTSQNQYACLSRAVSKSDGTYFLYEWLNPRPGIRVREINLKQKNKENAIFLISVSLTERNLAEQSKGNERY